MCLLGKNGHTSQHTHISLETVHMDYFISTNILKYAKIQIKSNIDKKHYKNVFYVYDF